MTNKSLSQQLCEECGIEEQKIIVVGFDEHDITLPIFKTVKQTSDEPCIRVIREHCLPDFENNNNNFIKIQELKIKSSNECLGFILWAQDYRFYDKKSFLDSLLCYLDCVQDIYLEDVKQAIREAKWEV